MDMRGSPSAIIPHADYSHKTPTKLPQNSHKIPTKQQRENLFSKAVACFLQGLLTDADKKMADPLGGLRNMAPPLSSL